MIKLVFMSTMLAISVHAVLAQNGQENQHTVDKLAAADRAPRISGIHRLTTADIQAVKEAVQDEILDYRFNKEFYEIGTNAGTHGHWISKLPIYIDPSTDGDGNGRAIYRLMPYGEVYRIFFVRKDGIVVLAGDPENRFPITEPSKLTVFIDVDEICDLIHKWIRLSFLVDERPLLTVVEGAATRQETRVGFSAWKAKNLRTK